MPSLLLLLVGLNPEAVACCLQLGHHLGTFPPLNKLRAAFHGPRAGMLYSSDVVSMFDGCFSFDVVVGAFCSRACRSLAPASRPGTNP